MNKYGRELDLILLLTDNKDYTTLELAQRLGITRRNLYYYLEYLRESGFTLIKNGTTYRLDRHSPFFKKLHESIAFSDDEATYLYRLLENGQKKDYQAQSIKAKLERYFNLEALTDVGQRKRTEQNAAMLKEAMRQRKIACLKAYSSPHSKTVSDRLVEPFLFFNDDMDVRCYEINSHSNKTFKPSRAASVEITDVEWLNEAQHKKIYTDIFMFSGEERHRVSMLLGRLSHNLLLEEHPLAEPFVQPTDNPEQWLFDTEVVSFLGIGRFVLGLYDDIQLLGNEAFVAYVEEKVKGLVDRQVNRLGSRQVDE